MLIGVVTLIFAIMSYFYKYVSTSDAEEKDNDEDEDESTALIPETGSTEDKIHTEHVDQDLDDKNDASHSQSEL